VFLAFRKRHSALIVACIGCLALMHPAPASAAPGGSCGPPTSAIVFDVDDSELRWSATLKCTVQKKHWNIIAELQQKDRYGNWTIFTYQIVQKYKSDTTSITANKTKQCDISTLRHYQYRVHILHATVRTASGDTFHEVYDWHGIVHGYYCNAGNY
jgi:hypothetical protein